VRRDAEDADAPGRVFYHGQDVGLGAVEQPGREEVARQDGFSLGPRNYDQVGPVRRGTGSIPAFFRISHAVDAAIFTPRPASSPWTLRYPHPGFSRASRSTRALAFRRVAGRPVLPRMALAAQRRRTMSRCQRTIVSGVTSSRSPWRRAFGITLNRVARSARSAQFSFRRRGCCRRDFRYAQRSQRHEPLGQEGYDIVGRYRHAVAQGRLAALVVASKYSLTYICERVMEGSDPDGREAQS
jgi:hypothetical protein